MKITIDYEGDNQGTRFVQMCMETGISYMVESYDWKQIGEKVKEDGKTVMKFIRLPEDAKHKINHPINRVYHPKEDETWEDSETLNSKGETR